MRARLKTIIKKFLILAVVLPTTPAAAASHHYDPWAHFKNPAGFQAESIGYPNYGCLQGGEKLEDGVGYRVMRPFRNRSYGHPELISVIHNLGLALAKSSNMEMLVGDMSQPRGGTTMSAHASHQTGLDADIWYELKKQTFVPSDRQRNEMSSPPIGHGDTISPVWSSVLWALLEETISSDKVDLVIVYPSVLQFLCKNPNKMGKEELSKLRPDWGHREHFHIRVKCPEGDIKCLNVPHQDYDWCANIDSIIAKGPQRGAPIKHRPPRSIVAPGCEGVFTQK